MCEWDTLMKCRCEYHTNCVRRGRYHMASKFHNHSNATDSEKLEILSRLNNNNCCEIVSEMRAKCMHCVDCTQQKMLNVREKRILRGRFSSIHGPTAVVMSRAKNIIYLRGTFTTRKFLCSTHAHTQIHTM